MLATGVGAAADVDGQLADIGIGFLDQGLAEGVAQIHGLSQRQIAGIGTGAGHDVVDAIGSRAGEADGLQLGVQALQISQRHEGEQEILRHREPQESVPEFLSSIGDAAHLGGGHIPLVYADVADGVVLLFLLLDGRLEPLVEAGLADAIFDHRG